jgi:hypothetical protein
LRTRREGRQRDLTRSDWRSTDSRRCKRRDRSEDR